MAHTFEGAREASSRAEARLGVTLARRYRLERVIGRGGAGTLYAGCDLRAGRTVAVKVLHAGGEATIARRRLEREAAVSAALSHPNVVAVFDSGEDEDGTAFVVMELLRGTSLHERLDRDGVLDPERLLELFAPILGALAVAHDRGVLHRDLKPANVFLCEGPDGIIIPKLLDFGIARIDGGAALTQPGRVVGTEGFMPPEQAQGGALSPASDLWSLAAVMFACLNGRLPFSPEVVANPDPPALPEPEIVHKGARPLIAVIGRALEWDPRARFADARAFARALLAAATHAGLAVPDAPDPLGLPDWPAWRAAALLDPATLGSGGFRVRTQATAPRASPAARTGLFRAPWPRPGERLRGRFDLVRHLGRGAMGAVFEARDATTGETVALKWLHRLEPSAIYRIKREFRSLAEISHANLVALHELFADPPDCFFFTMDLVRGRPFLDHVRAAGPDGGLVEARLRACLAQLARGVQHLHCAGKLHGDLKPQNVLVTADGQLSIVDFGLARSFVEAAARDAAEREFAGTPAYAAPEQLDPRSAGPASDWYAVGVMLYEALCGALPFEGNWQRIMHEKRRRDPVPPSRRARAAVPQDLERLCLRLLSRDPGARADGRDVLAVLGEPEGDARAVTAPIFVGRSAELAALRRAFERSRSGAFSAVVVRAPSGMGKTTLVERFLAEAAGRRAAVVLHGRCYAQEALPYKAFDGIVDALSSRLCALQDEVASSLLPEDAPALAQLFPVLRRVPAIARSEARGLPQRERDLRRRAFAALERLLAALASRGPVVLFIDDLQWSDADSVSLLRALLAPPRVPGVLLVLAYRDETRDGAPPEPWLAELVQAAPREDIELGPISHEAVTELARLLLGDSPARAAAHAIAQQAGGHPMLATALIRHARSRQSAGADLRGISLGAAIAAQLAELSSPARAVLETVSLAGQRLPRDLALAMAETGHAGATRELRLARLVREAPVGGEPHLEPYHDQVREVVAAGVPAERRRGLHARIAERLHARGDACLDMAVQQYLLAGDEPAAARLAERAAERATRSLAFHRAAELLELALRHAPSEQDAQRLSAWLGDAYVRAGLTLKAAESYERAAAAAPEEQAFELRREAMTQYLLSGHYEQGSRLLRALADTLGVALATTRAALWRGFAALLWFAWTGRPRLREPPLRPDAKLAAERTRLRLLWSAAVPALPVRPDLAAQLSGPALHLAARLGEPVIYGQALSFRLFGLPYLLGRRIAVFDRRLADAHALAVRHGGYWDRAFVRAIDGCAYLYVAEFERALECLWEPATSKEPRTPFGATVQSLARAAVIPALYWLGRVKDLAREIEPWIEHARSSGDRHLEVNFRVLGAHRFLRADAPERAHAEIRAARATPLDYVHPALCDPWWEASLALYEGRPEEGLAVCLRMQHDFRTRSGWSDAARALWLLTQGSCAAGIAARSNAPAGALALLRRSAEQARRIRAPSAEAVAAHLRGTLAGLEGDERGARVWLERAIAGYDALGMRLYAASLRLALARRGHAQGAALERSARAVFAEEGIASPERWAAMLAPAIAP